ncbi:polyprenyl synthetase family protein [Pengzhenrongella frigida]|uniref:Polyprenyl synthetase family protein n=1 Tax=Pengzhenrongella frigida TaxID=1259133 RepID=A0A4Q5N088_9MICO|nr:polyprenyl synthetase family protein [Cellulomonas sp. HLT2-17]RYV51439.1 polyprenyl synthetase family protein [Cellulomonas sp. HLT2-17]
MADVGRSGSSGSARAGVVERADTSADTSAGARAGRLDGLTPAGSVRDRLATEVELGVQASVRALNDHLRAGRAAAEAMAPAYGALWATLADQVGGGKLLRPRLMLAAYLGLGGTDIDGVAPIAAAQELLHTAMVVHDDVLDHDEMRRGRPNLAGARRAELAAVGVVGKAAEDQVLAAALLGGDLALTGAFDLVARAPIAPELRLGAVGLLVRSVTTTVGGELLDIAAELTGPTRVDAILIAELKTAAYTCSGPLVIGGLLAGADDATRAQLERLGTALGVAFQLVDDELGVFGDPEQTGKSVLSDIREGKRTELLRLSYLLADAAGRAVLDRHVGDPDLDEDDAARVRAVMADSGALDRTRGIAAGAARTARQTARLHLPAPLADYLCALVDELAGRDA